MPDLGSVQGANKKASEYGAGRDPGLFTELFTARYTAVTIASAPGYGHFGSLSRFTKPEDGGGRRGGVLGRCKFSPSFDYIISEPLKDTRLTRFYAYRIVHALCVSVRLVRFARFVTSCLAAFFYMF